MHNRRQEHKAVVPSSDYDSADDEVKLAPSAAKQQKLISQISTLTVTRQLSNSIRNAGSWRTMLLAGSVFVGIPKAMMLCNKIYNDFNITYCLSSQNGWILPAGASSCWRPDTYSQGASWKDYAYLSLLVTAFISQGYDFYRNSSYGLNLNALDQAARDRLNALDSEIKPTTSLRAAKKIIEKSAQPIKSILKDRRVSFVFFVSVKKSSKNGDDIFGDLVKSKIAEFLGCDDLPDKAKQYKNNHSIMKR